MLEGLDVSAHQSSTPPLAGVDFLIVRLAYGAAGDARARQHVSAARARRIPVAGYLFLRHPASSGQSIGDQVSTALGVAQLVGGVDGIAIDVEADGADPGPTTAEAGTALELLERAGQAPGLYHSSSGYPTIGQAWRWIADYRPVAEPPVAWDVWQWTSSAGKLDRDRFDGSRAELLELWKGNGSMSDIEVTSTTAELVDLVPTAARPIEILEPSGDKIRTKLTAPRLGVLSPFGSISAGGTRIRTIVWTAAAGGEILLAVYANDCSNVRPATPDCHPAAKAAAELVAKAAADAAGKV